MTDHDNTIEAFMAKVEAERRQRFIDGKAPHVLRDNLLRHELDEFDRRLRLLEDIVKNAWNAGRL